MHAIWAICRRDLQAAFSTPLAWLVLACWCFLTNLVFVVALHSLIGSASEQPVFANTLSFGILFLIPLAPAITMNAFAAERAQGTLQLLLTVPVRESELVIGKFLASFAVLLAMVAATTVQLLTLWFVSELHLPHVLIGFLGMVLACALLASLGLWVSLVVDSPVAAYVVTFAVIGALSLLSIGGEANYLHPIAAAIGLPDRTRSLFAGWLRSGDVTYFVAGTAIFLVLSHAALRARRIHG